MIPLYSSYYHTVLTKINYDEAVAFMCDPRTLVSCICRIMQHVRHVINSNIIHLLLIQSNTGRTIINCAKIFFGNT